jgi:hypothetical protein
MTPSAMSVRLIGPNVPFRRFCQMKRLSIVGIAYGRNENRAKIFREPDAAINENDGEQHTDEIAGQRGENRPTIVQSATRPKAVNQLFPEAEETS